MEAPKLETQALLKLFENLQGSAREEFAREVQRRTAFFCEVKFQAPPQQEVDPDEDDDDTPAEVVFTLTCGPMKNEFKFDCNSFPADDIKPLLTGADCTFTINDCNGYTGIRIENGSVEFQFCDAGSSLSTTVPYACCASAFQEFHEWKIRKVVKAETTSVTVISSKFENGLLSVAWELLFNNQRVTHEWKLQPESLRATTVEQWELLLAGETIDIAVQATDLFGAMHQVNGVMVPWDNYKEYIFRSKKEPELNLDDLDEEERAEILADQAERSHLGIVDLIHGFYRQEGVVNGGRGYRFNLDQMRPSIQQIVSLLRSDIR